MGEFSCDQRRDRSKTFTLKKLFIISSKMGWFVIKNKDTGKVLDIQEAGDEGANVIQYTQYNTDNQLWTWIDNALISKHRGYALDLSEARTWNKYYRMALS